MKSVDLCLTPSALFFPVALFLVLSGSDQLTSRCNPFSRCFSCRAFHSTNILNYPLTLYCPVELPVMVAVVISALAITVSTSHIDDEGSKCGWCDLDLKFYLILIHVSSTHSTALTSFPNALW